MDPIHLALIFFSGAAAGLMNAIAGGGTILTFPALIIAGIPPISANATSTLALLPSTLGSTFGYRRNIRAVWRWIRLFSVASMAGGLLGGILLLRTPATTFNSLVPLLILLATLLFTAQGFFARLFGLEPNCSDGRPRLRWLLGALFFQFLVSVYGGYFGAGIGILMLATLRMLGIGNIHEMNTVKGILGFLINVVAAVYFIYGGYIQWPAAGVMAIGAAIGGCLGAHFAQKIPHRTVRQMITAIGLILTVAMFAKQLIR